MTTVSISNFRKDIYNMVDQAVQYNETINITTKTGNAVLISEEDYRDMMETLYLISIPGMREKLLDGKNTPLSETVSEEEVAW